MFRPFAPLSSRVARARQSGDLLFAALISRETIESVFGEATAILNSGTVYNTAVTVWVFLSQVMSIDHGCVSAVARLIAWRFARGHSACSAATGAYCLARDKLDEDAMGRLVTASGRAIDRQTPESCRWKGHRVIVADGSTVTMADTPDNQREYPQSDSQTEGCGFPIMRIVVLFALSTGVVLESALGRYKGKRTHEVMLFRQIDAIIAEDDVLLADRVYSGWFEMARLEMRGAHYVIRMHQQRRPDFRSGIRYGRDDHAIRLDRPRRPQWMSADEYRGYPEFIMVREIRIRVENKGFRSREILIHTSLDDDIDYSKDDIAALFRRRWQAELNLRSLKTVMQMDHLRCKKPHRVRNELRAHLLAYNLIRQTMAEAALKAGSVPWQLSFKSTLSVLLEMLPLLMAARSVKTIGDLALDCCAQHIVGNRPDRNEPRVKKRRPKTYKLMQKPRNCYKPGQP